MDNRLDNAYIENAVEELVALIGVKEPPSADLPALIRAKMPEEAVSAVAHHLGLPVRIELSYVSSSGGAHHENGFRSKQLSATDNRGRGTSGIIAQVLIPQSLPIYGTPSLHNYPIRVRISEDYAHEPHTFLAIVAHELSHVLLQSLMHEKSNNEVYTDLVPILLGFGGIVQTGRKSVTSESDGFTRTTRTATYGYLTDSQFRSARDRVAEIVRCRYEAKRQLTDRAAYVRQSAFRLETELSRFRAFLTYLDKHPMRKVRANDVERIVGFHSPTYTVEWEAALREATKEVSQAGGLCEAPTHFTTGRMEALRQQCDVIVSLGEKLSGLSSRLHGDLETLRRNVGPLVRLHIALKTALTAAHAMR